ncbi:MAG TPA: ROK family protein [Candidatus Limnocylindrales bacterium]|nr:ROK family protein [Candidatus Limnocylindrales bacterium]
MTVEAAQPRRTPARRTPVRRASVPRMGPRPLVLALDLGASRIRTAAVGPGGALRARGERETGAVDGPEAVVSRCLAALEEVRGLLDPADRTALGALGISAPGPLDNRAGVLLDPPNLGPALHDLPLGPRLGAALGLPVAMDRDTHIAALAEQAFGAARGVDDFVYLTVSTGLGGAIVAGGRLFGGPDGLAGELGHLPVAVDGPPCACGGRGHLEAVASGSAIARAARETMGRDLDARAVAEAEEAGDPAAAAIMERARQAFAAALVGIVDALTPRLIIVGGSLARGQGERWLGPARERVAREAFRRPAARVAIVPAALGDDVGLAGAIPFLEARGLLPAGRPRTTAVRA